MLTYERKCPLNCQSGVGVVAAWLCCLNTELSADSVPQPELPAASSTHTYSIYCLSTYMHYMLHMLLEALSNCKIWCTVLKTSPKMFQLYYICSSGWTQSLKWAKFLQFLGLTGCLNRHSCEPSVVVKQVILVREAIEKVKNMLGT